MVRVASLGRRAKNSFFATDGGHFTSCLRSPQNARIGTVTKPLHIKRCEQWRRRRSTDRQTGRQPTGRVSISEANAAGGESEALNGDSFAIRVPIAAIAFALNFHKFSCLGYCVKRASVNVAVTAPGCFTCRLGCCNCKRRYATRTANDWRPMRRSMGRENRCFEAALATCKRIFVCEW